MISQTDILKLGFKYDTYGGLFEGDKVVNIYKNNLEWEIATYGQFGSGEYEFIILYTKYISLVARSIEEMREAILMSMEESQKKHQEVLNKLEV